MYIHFSKEAIIYFLDLKHKCLNSKKYWFFVENTQTKLSLSKTFLSISETMAQLSKTMAQLSETMAQLSETMAQLSKTMV